MDEEYAKLIAGRFGPRLRELRAKAGLSQAALAERCGVRQASVAEYERGTSLPTWPNVVRLALALGATPDSFTAAPAKNPEQDNRNSD